MKTKEMFLKLSVVGLCAGFMPSSLLACEEGMAGGRRPHFLESLSDEQKSCLKAELGEPGVGERPSREKAEAAFTKCGVERPEPPRHGSEHESAGDAKDQ